MRILKSYPLLKMVNSYVIDSPQPSNISYLCYIYSSFTSSRAILNIINILVIFIIMNTIPWVVHSIVELIGSLVSVNYLQTVHTIALDLNLVHLSFASVVSYNNAELLKKRIIKENRGKAGIYRWINNINGKSYVGSSINLTIRFNVYFNNNRLETGSGYRMAIYQAISKYGLNNFTLEILEYCDKNITIEREQFYLDKLKPEYNLLMKAGSIFGFKHSLLSRKKLSNLASGRLVSKETREKISEALSGRILSESTKEKIRNYKHTEEAKLRISLGNPRTRSVQMTDLLTKEITVFSTMTLAAAHLHTTTATIGNYIKSKKSYKDRYLFTVVSKNDN